MLHHQGIANYFTPSEENNKTDLSTPTTTCADVAEPEHYEPSLLNCDVSVTEITVPLMSKHLKMPVSYASRNIQIYHM
jgi:hypothetical protein